MDWWAKGKSFTRTVRYSALVALIAWISFLEAQNITSIITPSAFVVLWIFNFLFLELLSANLSMYYDNNGKTWKREDTNNYLLLLNGVK